MKFTILHILLLAVLSVCAVSAEPTAELTQEVAKSHISEAKQEQMTVYFGDSVKSPSFWATLSTLRNYPAPRPTVFPLPYQLPAEPKGTNPALINPIVSQGNRLVADLPQKPPLSSLEPEPIVKRFLVNDTP